MKAPEQHCVNAAVKMLTAAFPKPRQEGAQTDQWERCASLTSARGGPTLSHAERVASDPLVAARLGYWFAYYLNDRGEYEAAIPIHERTIAARARILGEEHRETLDAMNNLSSCFMRSGELILARDLRGEGSECEEAGFG